MHDPASGRSHSSTDLVSLRRDLHQHPELRFAEHRTAALLAARLEATGYAVRRHVGRTGVVGRLTTRRAGPHVVLRADMDAMPVTDLKSVPYASANAGVTHACGHDVHMAVITGVAERLAADPPTRGEVTILFQPAEERPFGEPSGAAEMLADGALPARVDAVLGLHCWPELPAGTIGVDDRVAMAAKDAFGIVLNGQAAHAATPSRGRDAVLSMAQLVTALHAGVARGLDASDLAAFNIGTIAGGRSQSVVPDRAEITGTLRTVDTEVRERIRGVIERATLGIAASMDLASALTWADEMPPVLNDARLVERAIAIGAAVLGEGRTVPLTAPPMTADDFALLTARGPSLYLKLGVARLQPWPALHSGDFDVDETCIDAGVDVLDALARDALDG